MELQQECVWELYVQDRELNLTAVPGRGVSLIRFYTCKLMCCALSPCLTLYVLLILLRLRCLYSSKKYCPV